jgi:hypothetical protein
MELWNKGEGWHLSDLTKQASAPDAISPPFGFESFLGKGGIGVGRAHVVYVGVFGHMQELSTNGTSPWKDTELPGPIAGVPIPSTSMPFAYSTNLPPKQGLFYRVPYIDVDQGVHELFTDAFGPWHHADLSEEFGAPGGASPTIPVGFQSNSAGSGSARVVYRGATSSPGDLIMLWIDGASPWQWLELTHKAKGLPREGVASLVCGYETNTEREGLVSRVIYVGNDNHIHELRNNDPSDPNSDWIHADLTVLAGGELTSPEDGIVGPLGFQTNLPEQGPVPRVIYRARVTGEIHQMSLDISGWHDAPLGAFGGVAGDLGPGFPFSAYVTNLPDQGQVARIVFLGPEGVQIHELSSVGGPWQELNLSEAAIPDP